MTNSAESRRSRSPALTRAVAILSLLAEHPKQPLGPSDLSRLTGVPKSTVLNLCGAMLDERLLRRGNGGYQLGDRLAELSNSYLKSVTEVEEFYELCRSTYPGLLQTVQLGVLGSGLSVVYLARHDGRDPLNLGLVSEIGRSVPAYCTATGKALLAATSDEDLQKRLPADGRLEPITTRSIQSVDRLHEELEATRARGYSIESGEIVEGLRCFGIAVRTPRRSDGLIGVSFTLTERSASADPSAIVAELHSFAEAFADRIGSKLVH
ncbi:IclR family transcriptional regulator [Acrocarpospora macrocephala]|uniref:IclR family transcriptional regulator n=1 Tax=Acrocarpospora macrocephala TaxID=150177 RepID=A0A5M3WLG7_9ACTN|nr:IclR family transcriptional regulator [Acrocarpospora macrocephala]GES09714.1 IclR family transcriptional regulator [Acrocarpospora macrocephala]